MYATAMTFGNVNANPELGLGRFAAEEPRAYVLGRGWAVQLPYMSNKGKVIKPITVSFRDR